MSFKKTLLYSIDYFIDHRHVDEVINETRFICLAELQTFEL